MDLTSMRETLIEAADMREVASDLLGMPTKVIGGRTNILCPLPGHNDREFGSCVVWKERGYCFACNEGFNVIDLVMHVNKSGFLDAVKLIADFYGLHITLDKTDPVVPIVLPAALFQAVGITDTAGFKKLYTETPENAVSYLRDEMDAALQRLRQLEKRNIPKEIEALLYQRIEVIAAAYKTLKKLEGSDKPLRIQ